ncbi:tripartite-type tricarboxylate transporter receptor subunit TctC [Comamonas odontotermitis]|uniref:Tripartite-type tricarboxylate transporter receptor subunit TctC n=1 Tax=Comamonas odontotermitis TaxID=379895 RepID=A0ABR6RLC4_9BURK|nr:tripartite tricarboxylate transporter substrate binding protein [Comamonas odontotermitis]MBB6579819.1 tripartite-type tricarboxylate transporter receptor subunit TctC [Comamonas odontotermitis]
MQRRTFAAAVASIAALGAAGFAAPAVAQADYPNRPIVLIVPYGAGGVSDVVARALALSMGKQLGQSVIIENKPGAGASMGVMDMKNAKPDGYRLTLSPVGIFRQPHIQKVAYDPIADLSYVAAYMSYDFLLAVAQDSPFKSVKDIVEQSKRQPGSVDYGTPGKFSANHVLMALLEKKAGVQFTHVPYKGDAEAVNALIAGHTKTGVFGNTVLPHMQSGKLRALAIASETRPPAFANVPTFREQGYDVVTPSPLGIAGPRGLPPEIVRKLEAAVKSAMDDPAFQQAAANYGVRLEFRNAQDYSAFAKKAFAEEGAIVQSIGLE